MISASINIPSRCNAVASSVFMTLDLSVTLIPVLLISSRAEEAEASALSFRLPLIFCMVEEMLAETCPTEWPELLDKEVILIEASFEAESTTEEPPKEASLAQFPAWVPALWPLTRSSSSRFPGSIPAP